MSCVRWGSRTRPRGGAAGGGRPRKPGCSRAALDPDAGGHRAAASAPRVKKFRATDVLSPQDEPLFEALREWRRRAADEAAMPPYIVFSDRTLVSIAQARPSTPAELLGISGVGAQKLEKWGSAVL